MQLTQSSMHCTVIYVVDAKVLYFMLPIQYTMHCMVIPVDAHGYFCVLQGDAGFRDENGYLHIMSRTDDIINVAGAYRASASLY